MKIIHLFNLIVPSVFEPSDVVPCSARWALWEVRSTCKKKRSVLHKEDDNVVQIASNQKHQASSPKISDRRPWDLPSSFLAKGRERSCLSKSDAFLGILAPFFVFLFFSPFPFPVSSFLLPFLSLLFTSSCRSFLFKFSLRFWLCFHNERDFVSGDR